LGICCCSSLKRVDGDVVVVAVVVNTFSSSLSIEK
jgi:hypothetical protein